MYNLNMKTKTILKNHQKFNTIPLHIEKFVPDKSINMHYHDCVELIFCTKGHGLTTIEDISLKLSKAGLFVIGGKQAHTMSDFKEFEAYRLLFDFSMLDALDEKTKNTFGFTSLFLLSDSGYTNYDYRCCITMTEHYFERLSVLMQELLFEYENDASPDESYMKLLFCSICTLIIKCFESRQKHPSEILFVKIITELVKHLNESITVEEVAKSFGVSGRYFRKLFAEYEDFSPAQFLINMRLRRAKTLLSCSNMSLTEIAFSCGFYDSSHFTRLFKKHEGMSPKEYRKSTIL